MATDSLSTSLSLLERARARDSDAWRRILHLYSPLVATWCRQWGLRAEDCEDVAQEVFSSVAAHLGDFQRDTKCGSFRGWLFTITRNKLRDYLRRTGKQPAAAGGSTAQYRISQLTGDDDDSVDAVAEGNEVFRRAVEMVRGEFEQRSWLAFWRMAVEGKSAGEVAAEMGLSPGAVRQAKYKVLRRLRSELDGLLDWPDGA